jgi:hypothetical protein
MTRALAEENALHLISETYLLKRIRLQCNATNATKCNEIPPVSFPAPTDSHDPSPYPRPS